MRAGASPLRPTVVLIDDHELFRQGLEALLSLEFEVVAVGGSAQDALALCALTEPDLLILDVELGDAPAEQTVRAIRRNSPGVVVVILTMFEDAVLRRQLLRAGASEFVSKTVGHQTLADTLQRALIAGPTFSDVKPVDDSGLLSPRELEVLRLIAAAASNRDIAIQLVISEATVKRHTANIYLKLGAVSRIDAVLRASRLGLVT